MNNQIVKSNAAFSAQVGNWLATLLLILLPLQAAAEYQRLEAIVAVVDDDVVLASELMTRLETVRRSIAENDLQPPPGDVLINQIMERLIIENIQLQEAEKRGVTVDDESLARAVGGFASSNNMTMEEFQQNLAEDGTSYRQFREDIRSELIISRLQRAMINRRIAISEQDVQALLNSPFYQQMFSDEYRVGHIMRSLEDDATEADREAAVVEAAGFAEELRNGAVFVQQGTTNNHRQYVNSNDSTITMESTAIAYAQVGSGGGFTATGNGLIDDGTTVDLALDTSSGLTKTKNGNKLAVNADGTTIQISGGDALELVDNGVSLAKMAGITRGSIIYGDTNGDPALLAVGAAGAIKSATVPRPGRERSHAT